MAHPIFTEDHDLIRSQLRRFVDDVVKPQGPKWEEAGFVPRAVLREMGELGLLGIRYDSRHGGSELDTLASVVRHVEGALAPVSCVSDRFYEKCTCPDEARCPIREVMAEVRAAVVAIRRNTSG